MSKTRQFFDWLEHWALDDDNAFYAVGRTLLVLAIATLIIILPFAIYDSTQPAFTLRKSEWSCAQSHYETLMVAVGKVVVPEQVSVCDNYVRIRGNHDAGNLR